MFDNDNEDAFIHISAITANVTRYLCSPKKDGGEVGRAEQNDEAGEKKDDPERRDFVALRIREIADFEKRARGVGKK